MITTIGSSEKFLITLGLLLFLTPLPLRAESTLDHIVVTGSRTATLISDVTGNITTLEAEDLERIYPTHITETMARVAGVWISRGNGQEHLTAIRSPVLTGAGSCGAFFMAEDGISLRAPGFCNANQLFGVNHEQAGAIEVIRGPGSVFHGANAVHGVVNVLTPGWEDLPARSVSLAAGSHGYRRVMFSGKAGAGAHGLAFYGNGTIDGGYQEDSGFDQQKLDALHEYKRDEWRVSSHVSVTNLNQETAGFIQGFEAYRDPDIRKSNPNPEAFRDSRSFRAYSQLVKKSEQGTITLKPYLRYHKMVFLQHYVPWKAQEENGHHSLGLQAYRSEQRQNLAFSYGADIDLTRGWLKESQADDFSPEIPRGDHYDYDVDAMTLSPFVEWNWQAGSALLLSAGARYEYLSYDYHTRLSPGNACAAEVDDCRFYRPADRRVSFRNLSGKFGLSYEVQDNHYVYGQLSNGYRPPQATELFRLQEGQEIPDLASEQMTSLELGVRGEARPQGLPVYYDVTWFLMEKSDHIFQDSDRQVVSDGETRHKGLELSMKWMFTPDWSVGVAASFADHYYRNNANISNGSQVRGHQIDTAPSVLANVALAWQRAGYFTEIEWSRTGSYYLDPANTARYSGHQLVNIRAGAGVGRNFSVSIRIMNVLDKDYAERADFAFGSYRYFVGEPRSLYTSLEYRI